MGSGVPPRDSRRRILAAALDEFDVNGYGATSMSAIRRTAGVSNGSLYHHFASKEQIAAAILVDAVVDYQERFLGRLLATADAQAGIVAGVEAHLSWAHANRARARYLIAGLDPAIRIAADPELRPLTRSFLGTVFGWVDEHVQRGALRDLGRELTYAVWLGPAQELIRQWLLGRPEADPDVAAGPLGDAAWRGLRAAG